MKNFFALSFILILSIIPSESFTIEETAVELQSIDFQNNVSISLSDGISCIAQIDPCEIGILQTWNVGDRIEITAPPSFKGLILINQNSDIFYSPKIKLTQDSIEKLPTIVKKSKIRNEDADSSYNKFSLYLSLSDGSVWKYDLWSFDHETFSYWKVGHRVLLNVDFEEEEAKMINYNLIFGRNYLRASQSYFKKVSE